MKIHLVSLGCARNLVDSETMTGQLVKAGYQMTETPADAKTIIINTCSFIEPAINESIDTILELARFKRNGLCQQLIVTGCLPERFQEDIAATLPEVDVFLGTGAFDRIVDVIMSGPGKQQSFLPEPDTVDFFGANTQRIKSTSHMAYLKIAEGCDKQCTYCIIPRLRGRQKSRLSKNILTEAKMLIAAGARELVLVAQDTTAYGRDLGRKNGLADLLRQLSDLSQDVWIRVLYGHPESIQDDIISVIHERDNICTYFDIPIQHADDAILKRMGRHDSQADLLRLFERIRSTAPDACLRTTVITGFPGETETEFDVLYRFIDKIQFDHLGVFIYSDGEDLPAHKLSAHVPEKVATARKDAIMARQLEISSTNNRKYLGQIHTVLVEEAPETGVYLGRTRFQAPDVDGLTFIHGRNIDLGSFTDVRISDTLEYDLSGEVI